MLGKMSGNSLVWKMVCAVGAAAVLYADSGGQSPDGRSLEERAEMHLFAGQASTAEANYRIVVSLNDLKMYILRGNMIEKEFPVAVGDFDTPTPTGEYLIHAKVRDPVWRIPRKIYKLREKYNSRRIYPSDPENPIKYYWIELKKADNPSEEISFGIHGTNKPELIPDWISMGCIRMTKEGIFYLVDNIPLQTRITIMEKYWLK